MNAAAPAGPRNWSRHRWLTVLALIFIAHIGFIFIFGARKPIAPRAATRVPQLQIADANSELIMLNDPTLFALPNMKDFAAAAWLKMPDVKQPLFHWTEPPRWLPLSAGELGAAFIRFMQTNYFAGYELQFKPPAQLSAPGSPVEPALAQTSTLQIQGDLAPRRMLNEINLPSVPYNDVIAPSKVQALVNVNGTVVSAVLLSSSGLDDVDQRALQFARTARFAPSSRLTLGQLIFNWHTVPAATTTAPVTSP